MAEHKNGIGAIKIAGYLEKKGKNRVVSTWKKYWFILEGRLLLYYKSESEVTNLYPCRGSINMGLASDVRPLISQAHNLTGVYMFEIVTHINNTILLRTKDKNLQEKWLQALLDALGQPKITKPIHFNHFRYSMDNLILTTNQTTIGSYNKQRVNSGEQLLKRQNTLPQNIKYGETLSSVLLRRETFLERIRKIRGQHSRSLDAILKEVDSPKNRISLTIEEDIIESSGSETDKEISELDNKEISDSLSFPNDEIIISDENKNCIKTNTDLFDDTDDDGLISFKDNDVIMFDNNNMDKAENNSLISKESNDTDKRKRIKFPLSFKSKNKDEKTKTTKVKRKSSFLNKFFKQTRKKDECNENNDTSINNIELIVDDKENSNKDNKKLIGALELIKPETLRELNEKLKSSDTSLNTDINICINKEEIETSQNKEEIVPCLPPRRGSRPKSPWHDVPTNNTPYLKTTNFREQIVSPHQYQNDVTNLFVPHNEEISNLNEEPMEKDACELSVRQLIKKFDQCELCVEKHKIIKQESCSELADVKLRKPKCDNCQNKSTNNSARNSNELNQLLNELSKITTAPLIQPRTVNSLIQVPEMKLSTTVQQIVNHQSCGPMTDEEWLAIAPIRRRRFSEPDYDVPRSHRSLDFVPPLPPKLNTVQNNKITENSAQIISDSIEPSIVWSRSITPDSLETSNDNSIKKPHDELDRSMGNDQLIQNKSLLPIQENFYFNNNLIQNVNQLINDHYFDSLEQSTLF